jgi:hypothetical protein
MDVQDYPICDAIVFWHGLINVPGGRMQRFLTKAVSVWRHPRVCLRTGPRRQALWWALGLSSTLSSTSTKRSGSMATGWVWK